MDDELEGMINFFEDSLEEDLYIFVYCVHQEYIIYYIVIFSTSWRK